MRQTAARLNRAWLIVIGLLLVLGGVVVLLAGTGLLLPLAARAGLVLDRPRPDAHLFGAASAAAFALTWVIALTALVSLVLALLGLGWLGAQIPRTNEARPFRLQDDAGTGLTRCAPSVLTDAVERQVLAIPGVVGSAAVLRGTAAQPDLTIRVTAADRTRIPDLLRTLQGQVATDLGTALDTRVARLGVQVEIDTVRVRNDRISVRAAPPVPPGPSDTSSARTPTG